MSDLRDALTWALSELRGQTVYTNAEQRQNCFDLADDALSSYEPAEPVSRPAGEGEREAVARIIDLTAFEPMTGHTPVQRQKDALTKADAILSLLRHAAPDAGGGVTFDGDDMVAAADALTPWMKNYPPSTRRERCVEAANAVLTAFCARKQPTLKPGGER